MVFPYNSRDLLIRVFHVYILTYIKVTVNSEGSVVTYCYFLGVGLALTVLNIVWFKKMIDGFLKRISGKDKVFDFCINYLDREDYQD
jgi:hypothetical protein